MVLEQAESLRTGGTSLTLFKNGWRVLDAISVGPQLRTQFLEIEGYSFFLPIERDETKQNNTRSLCFKRARSCFFFGFT